jgi:hypothetical protein
MNIVELAQNVQTAESNLASAKAALAAAVNGTPAPKAAKAKGKTKAAEGRKARSTVDHEAVIADLKKGDMNAKAIAEKHGCALPTVNLIKKNAGLTKARK